MATTPDSSGNGYTGTLVGSTLPSLVASPWSGFGQALLLPGPSGTDAAVDCGAWSAGGVPLPTGAFTIEARIKQDADAVSGNIAGWFNTDQPPQISSGPVGSSYSAFYHSGSLGGGTVTSGGDEVALDWDGASTMRLYVNGVMVEKDTTVTTLSPGVLPASPDPTDAFRIGTDQGLEQTDGIVDEVRYSSVARYASDAGYTPSGAPFAADSHTVALYHLDSLGAEALAEGAATADSLTHGPDRAVADSAATADAAAGVLEPHVFDSAAAADSLGVGADEMNAALAETNLAADSLTPSFVAIRGPVYARSVVRSTASGSARIQPPAPAPGPSGLHDYQVIVCDKYGVALGQINSAVPTQVDWVLNGVGQALIDFWILDPSMGSGTTARSVAGPNGDALLPISSLPGGREVQIWRDGQLIFWGVPVSATFDAKQVHLTCQSLLWYVAQLDFGPITTNFAGNPGFEEPWDNSTPYAGIPGWLLDNGGPTSASCAVDVPAAGFQVLAGAQSAQIASAVSDDSIYLYQDVSFTSGPEGLAVEMSAWFYIEGPFTPNPSNLGIQIIGADVTGSQSITPNTAPNQWNRIVCDAFINPNSTEVLQFQLYGVKGIVFWDQVNVSVQESVSSPLTGCDAQLIIAAIVDYANDPARGKSDHAMPFAGPPTGQTLVRAYQFYDNAPILDALNEYPTIGVCDFDVTWDATGHYRQFEIFPPAKGVYNYDHPMELDLGNVTDLQGSVDGTQSATAVRWLGQGSTGSSEDMGYAAFPSALGGRVDAGGGSTTFGSNVVTSSGLGFTTDDVGQPIYCLNSDALAIGTTITSIISSTQCQVSKPAKLTLSGSVLGIGGLILDGVQSALPDQPVGTLQGSADNYLQRFMGPQFLPTAKMRADGPRGLFGNVSTGDVLPVVFDYGWLAYGPTMARANTITLYPPTEEVAVQLAPVPVLQAGYS